MFCLLPRYLGGGWQGPTVALPKQSAVSCGGAENPRSSARPNPTPPAPSTPSPWLTQVSVLHTHHELGPSTSSDSSAWRMLGSNPCARGTRDWYCEPHLLVSARAPRETSTSSGRQRISHGHTCWLTPQPGALPILSCKCHAKTVHWVTHRPSCPAFLPAWDPSTGSQLTSEGTETRWEPCAGDISTAQAPTVT